jgi:O-antigen ligase
MDVSVTNRLVESREAIKKILEQPIIGYGVGSEFARFNIIDHATTVTLYMHNGYLFLLYKTGIIGFIPYMAFLLIVIWTGIRLSFDAALDDVQRGLVRAFAAILPAMLVVNTTSNVFIQKQALLVLAFGTACVMGGHAARKAAAAEAGETG